MLRLRHPLRPIVVYFRDPGEQKIPSDAMLRRRLSAPKGSLPISLAKMQIDYFKLNFALWAGRNDNIADGLPNKGPRHR
jgi:hypothetical protein